MTIQDYSSSVAIWKRVFKILRGEGPRGVFGRIKERFHSSFRYVGGYLVTCPMETNAVIPNTGSQEEVEVEQVFPDDPIVLQEIHKVYPPPYTEALIYERWKQQDLLCFVGRVEGEVVGCVWVKPEGDIVEFTRPIFRLAEDEAYYKDAMVKPEWRGKGIYPAIKAISGQILCAKYGKTKALSFVHYSNKASLNASKKLGGKVAGRITHLKLFRRKNTWLRRMRERDI